MSTRGFVGSDGNRLVASIHGSGARDVLLLHGGGQTRHAWAGTARALAAAGWRAVAPDQRGHGESDRAVDGNYLPMAFAADAVAVAEQLAAESGRRPVAVGASLGGIASLLALGSNRLSPVFSALVLVDIVPRMDRSGVEHVEGFMRTHLRDGFATVEDAAAAIAAYLPHRPRPRSLEGLRKNLRQGPDGRWYWHWDPLFMDGPLRLGTDRDAMEDELDAIARSLKVPCLLVRGGSSELVTEEAVARFLESVPQARCVDIAAARHMVAGDRNDAFTEAVTTFLAEL